MPLTLRFFQFNAVEVAISFGSTPLTPLFDHYNGANAAISPVKRRWRRYFSGKTALTPLFFPYKGVNANFFPVQGS